jgi:hypothetical protein
LKWPDGKLETFQYEVNEKIQPNLKVLDHYGNSAIYAWDSGSAKIVFSDDQDGQWNYKVAGTSDDIVLPRIDRTNRKGEIEFLYVDNLKGVTERKLLKGGHTITEVFKSPGPLYDKVRKIEKLEEDGARRLAYQSSYSETGKLLREVDEKGFVSIYSYGQTGELTSRKIFLPKNSEILKSLKSKEIFLESEIARASTSIERDKAVERLACFFIYELKTPSRVSEISNSISCRPLQYFVRLQAISGDRSLTREDKNSAYKTLIKDFPEYRDSLLARLN